MRQNSLRYYLILTLSLAAVTFFEYTDSIEKKAYATITGMESNQLTNSDTRELSNFKITTGEELVKGEDQNSNVYKAEVINNEYKVNIQFDAESNIDIKKFIIIGTDNSIVGSISNESPFIATVNLKEGENIIKIINKSDYNEVYKFKINYKAAKISGLKNTINVGDTFKLIGIIDGDEYDNIQWSSTSDGNAIISKDGIVKCISGGFATATGTIYDKDNEDIIGSLSVKFNVNGEGKYGWIKNGGNWYYIDSETKKLQTGWLFYNNEWYYFQSDGTLKYGWLYLDKTWYYIKSTGNMATGWIKDKGKWYLLDQSGAMKTGWIRDHGNWYYLNSDGSMETNQEKIDGKTYIFNEHGELQKQI